MSTFSWSMRRHLVDGDVDLGPRVDENGVDAVALDPAFLVEHVDRGLGADLRGLRAGVGERAGDIVDEADLDLFLLRERRERKYGDRKNGERR